MEAVVLQQVVEAGGDAVMILQHVINRARRRCGLGVGCTKCRSARMFGSNYPSRSLRAC